MTEINPKVKLRLRRIGKVRWDVLAVLDSDDRTVEDRLLELDPSIANRARVMLELLRTYVPQNGPPTVNELRCSSLRGGILEFKSGPRRGGKKLRVLWFYDASNRIICTHFFLKDTQQTPPALIDAAIAVRKAYLEQVLKDGVPVVPRRETN